LYEEEKGACKPLEIHRCGLEWKNISRGWEGENLLKVRKQTFQVMNPEHGAALHKGEMWSAA